MLFESSALEPGQLTTLEEYVKRMPEEQKSLYYVVASSREVRRKTCFRLRCSPRKLFRTCVGGEV